MASPTDIIIIGGGGDDGGRVAADSTTTIKIKVPGGMSSEQVARIVQAVLDITGGEVQE